MADTVLLLENDLKLLEDVRLRGRDAPPKVDWGRRDCGTYLAAKPADVEYSSLDR